jgi:hypothetical protein
MPVYLLTMHAYRSWREDRPEGYVQRGEGRMLPNESLARWRAERASHPEARFERDVQQTMHEIIALIAAERHVRLHACVTTPTHVHVLMSFRNPACTCGASEHCRRGCEGKEHAETVIVRMKRKMGQAVAQKMGTRGRPWFSRGWDATPVRTQDHFDHLMEVYLPGHEAEQAGIFRAIRNPG